MLFKPLYLLLRSKTNTNQTMAKNIKKTIGIVAGAIVLLLLAGIIYRAFFRPVYAGNTQNTTGLLIFGLLTGSVIAYLLFQLRNSKKPASQITANSHTVVESMKRVFKIVVAEGQLNEVFNYENTKKLLKFIPSTKKALVIVRAKVLVGYDVEKCTWEVDEENRKIRITSFPKPEILSLEPDFNYYYFEDDLFNLIGRKDLHDIQSLAKEQVKSAALNSGLIQIAADQMKLLLTEIVNANQWQLEGIEKIDEHKYIAAPQSTHLGDEVSITHVQGDELKEG